jgi:hypothetical protein
MPLGWNIAVIRKGNNGTSPAAFGAPHGARLGVWQKVVSGLDRIDALVAEERAILLGGKGYPLEHTTQVCSPLPKLEGTRPESAMVNPSKLEELPKSRGNSFRAYRDVLASRVHQPGSMIMNRPAALDARKQASPASCPII